MDWLIRYLVGLPARKKDYDELLAALPELIEEQQGSERLRFSGWGHFHVRGSFGRIDFDGGEIRFGDLIDWAKKGQDRVDEKETNYTSETNCPLSDCPLKQSVEPLEIKIGNFELLSAVGGGPNRKPPKDSFLNLVRKVHKGLIIKEVIITDPYIYSDVGEQGNQGGINNLIDYLSALGLDRDSDFTLKTNPSPKKFDETSRKIFKKTVNNTFSKAKFLKYKSKYSFHDRLYLVRDTERQLSGVFGPSLNGLTANSIILMGELDIKKDLKILGDWFA